ncbi:transcriptional regulator [Streptomyces sp. NPDC039022]|uniref:transcriptional regulator n=1 Tax=Streptomyces sp. NPDC039022 TaxID=3157091 RepID=UPI0033D0DC94
MSERSRGASAGAGEGHPAGLFRGYATGEQCDCSSERLGLDHLHKSTVSHPMRIMREAGLASPRAVGRNRSVRLRRAGLDARFPGLVESLLASTPPSAQ